MAVYTININERTKAGKGLVQYLRALGVIEEEGKATEYDPTDCEAYREAMKDVAEGRVYCYSSLEELKARLSDAEV